MVKNAPSTVNLRGSTSSLSLHPLQPSSVASTVSQQPPPPTLKHSQPPDPLPPSALQSTTFSNYSSSVPPGSLSVPPPATSLQPPTLRPSPKDGFPYGTETSPTENVPRKDGGKQKSLYEKYNEEMEQATKKFETCREIYNEQASGPSLYEKYREDMSEATKRYSDAVQAVPHLSSGGPPSQPPAMNFTHQNGMRYGGSMADFTHNRSVEGDSLRAELQKLKNDMAEFDRGKHGAGYDRAEADLVPGKSIENELPLNKSYMPNGSGLLPENASAYALEPRDSSRPSNTRFDDLDGLEQLEAKLLAEASSSAQRAARVIIAKMKADLVVTDCLREEAFERDPMLAECGKLNRTKQDTKDAEREDGEEGEASSMEFRDIVGRKTRGKSLITKAMDQVRLQSALKSPESYTKPFCEFLTENPTVWHAVKYFEKKLDVAGFKKLSERQAWDSTLKKGGKYYTARNGSSLIAFTVGTNYKSGNGVAMIAGHIDALTARLKPVSNKTTKAGYVQLGVAPYAGALNSTWWDRDLGIAGRVLVKDGVTGKIETKLVNLPWPIARIPTLAPHFGVGMTGSNNTETEAVPIIGLDYTSSFHAEPGFSNITLGGQGSFTASQPPKLVRAIAGELSIQDYSSIVNWELELYDTQPAQVGGLEKEFIFAGRIDDKLCSWAAMEGLLASASSSSTTHDGIIKLVGVFDDEEIGSSLRQGARGNFLPGTISRITESFAQPSSTANILSQTYANSFLISADVTHAVNPNFLSRYLENHAPRLNVGLVVCADSNGHMTTDSVSTALLTRVAETSNCKLQVFMIRNDSRSGGTIGPALSSAMGVRAIDAGIPQLSMHSIRAATGSLDPGLGVRIFAGFYENFEKIDKEFE